MDGVADAMRDAAAKATDHAAKARAAVLGAGPAAARGASRLTYTSAYMLSYGVVYAVVFVAKSLPQQNALMHGLRDGGAAAVVDIEIKAAQRGKAPVLELPNPATVEAAQAH